MELVHSRAPSQSLARSECNVHELERKLNTDERRRVGGERTGHGRAEARPEGGDTVLGDELARAVEEALVGAVGGRLDARLDGLALALTFIPG